MPRFKILECTEDGISKCAEAVKKGAVVVFPTDTVYGIGCDLYNDSAIRRIFTIKGRDEEKPLPVLACNVEYARRIVELEGAGEILARKYWPGALTIVAPLIDLVISRWVTAGCDTLGIRVPGNRCILSLLERCRFLVGTSANISGEKALSSAQEVLDSGLEGFDILLDGGRVEKGIESTVVDLASGRVIREGAIKAEEIERLIRGTQL
ncbi:MAG: threonylcarbamoyl-AMP synthase [Nitrososphaera sp.]|nr:threonylcarbamoyl-AMP synthase [Nitrososphaera sp.]